MAINCVDDENSWSKSLKQLSNLTRYSCGLFITLLHILSLMLIKIGARNLNKVLNILDEKPVNTPFLGLALFFICSMLSAQL